MNKKTGTLLLMIFFLASCKKNNEVPVSPSGIYTGTFTRVGMVLSKPGNVTINFSGNAFTGESDQVHNPGICSGTYQLVQDSIHFKNACIFAADFDWSLILSGKYKISSYGDSLTISRMYVGFIVYSDTYRLKKQ